MHGVELLLQLSWWVLGADRIIKFTAQTSHLKASDGPITQKSHMDLDFKLPKIHVFRCRVWVQVHHSLGTLNISILCKTELRKRITFTLKPVNQSEHSTIGFLRWVTQLKTWITLTIFTVQFLPGPFGGEGGVRGRLILEKAYLKFSARS